VKKLLDLDSFSLIGPLIPLYKLSCKLKMDRWLKAALLPDKYKRQIEDLNAYT
jgi:hypothetical protein